MFRGLTWDHPRGRVALEQAQGPITWDVQPLEGFESADIAQNCAAYDLVVLDHPHLGEALNAGCLRPLDEIFAADAIAAIAGRTIGPCLDSYESGGRYWALPLDAATQVMALRPDIVGDVPDTWQDVIDFARDGGRVGLSLGGPHAFLTFLSVAHAIKPDMDLRNGDAWVPDDVAGAAIEIISELARVTPQATLGLNPIGILEHMSRNDDLALCPLVYGYVNYAELSRTHSLAFHNAPRIGTGQRGTILGGTGIAISTRCDVSDELRDHLLWLMSHDVQAGYIPEHQGQPSTRAAWNSPTVNARVGGFYSNTADSLEAAAIRPRHNGYIAFQSAASAHLCDGFATGVSTARIIREMEEMFAASRENQLKGLTT